MNDVLFFLARTLVYGCVGTQLEILFTGLHSTIVMRDRNAICRTSLLMIPIYGLGADGLGAIRAGIHFAPVFIPVATLFIYLLEYSSGWIFRRLGIKIWDYSHAKFSVHGLVRIDYLPFWLLVAYAFDQLSDSVTKVLEFVGRVA